MTINKQVLREAANAANAASWGNWEYYKPHKGARGYEVKVGVKAVAQHCLKVDSVFIAAANPITVLALLDEMEAAEKRIAELERKEQHSDRQSVIDALASSGEEWSDIEEYMQKWDAERAAAAGKGERA
ncbi:ead/Ea22-like family protein [Enterobacter roggenkampii]|uniref:ead/Ea22-like family protein n=1 Tax=Enterobacter roggenkampii TaxID=1812935 RepID=UPI002019E707|nr:ead/Ea22-like family protein [Enterobacter roggenkampii]UQQ43558.1 ead/Ea22-like family protein [Enterobacter roggenkampii]